MNNIFYLVNKLFVFPLKTPKLQFGEDLRRYPKKNKKTNHFHLLHIIVYCN